MPIQIRPEGEAALYAQAGQVIGRAQKAEREEQLAFQREQTLIEITERRKQQQAARDWDLQKMLLNSQQDFAQEQRLRQVELNREARAKEWELEKMQLRSQIDFETEERARQKEYDEFLTTDKYINDKVASGEWAPERAEGPLFMNAYKHGNLGKPEITARLGSSPEYVQKLQGVRVQRPASISEQQWGLLTPEEQFKTARIHAGLEPRAQAMEEEDLAKERRQLEAVVGEVELPSYMSLPELRQRAAEILGITTGAGQEQVTPVSQQPAQSGITATNPQTGERIISYDNGQTWQPLR